jgi:hypothetical protein
MYSFISLTHSKFYNSCFTLPHGNVTVYVNIFLYYGGPTPSLVATQRKRPCTLPSKLKYQHDSITQGESTAISLKFPRTLLRQVREFEVTRTKGTRIKSGKVYPQFIYIYRSINLKGKNFRLALSQNVVVAIAIAII